ncbi:hypothetical protein ACK83U_26900 (plasmid) [Rhizobium sp. WW22]|uniref:hypothetical protein n=1 Tax=unclassified Rhizobium TaxID=2613769 RepID=UPI000DD88E67|nr:MULTISPECIES: hypothetical protein [unclassified Rhizobium]MBB3383977.1 hypothetical protein [Rhizobium sp. BK098]MBB3615677.1 hypothetical protein [Rhizobium sp. BK609]MBB3681337.1 hypothetical protein [Rhizobium sp. BK612]
MHLTRRQFAIMACALTLRAGQSAAASEEKAVFWQANLADRSINIFGYERVNAALVSDIVRDGERISEQAISVYTDIGPNAPHLKYSTNIKQIPPVLPYLPPADAEYLRRIVSAAAGAPVDRLPGYVVSLLLMGEGQHPWTPSVEGVIMDHVRSSGKQISPLISDTDLMSIWSPPDSFTLEAVGAHQISYLLEKRRQLGPIGGYMETLYEQRRVSEITQLREEILKEGVVNPLGSLAGPQFKALLLKQVLKIEATQNFLLLPLAVLLGNNGLLELMKANGFQIKMLA